MLPGESGDPAGTPDTLLGGRRIFASSLFQRRGRLLDPVYLTDRYMPCLRGSLALIQQSLQSPLRKPSR
jgi:hypothetical protein